MRLARVLIDARPLTNKYRNRGVGNYARSLIQVMLQEKAVEWHLLGYDTTQEFNQSLLGKEEAIGLTYKYHSLGKSNNILERLSAKLYSKLTYLPTVNRVKPDILISFQPDLGIPPKVDTIAIVHDIIPYKLNNYSDKNRLINYINKLNYIWWLNNLQNAAKVITISEYTKTDLIDYGISPDKITVTPLALSTKFASAIEDSLHQNVDEEHHKRRIQNIYNITEPYIIYYGGLEPNKNVHQLLKIFASITDKQPELKLVIAGADFKLGWDHKAQPINKRAEIIDQLARELKIRHKLIFTGFVEDKHLPVIIKYSKCFIHLSIYEGFGLTLLEAQAAGTPVIAANRSSYPEVIGESGLLVDPDDIKSVAAAILKFVNVDKNSNELREKFINAGFENVKRFSWKHTSAKTIQVIKSLLVSKQVAPDLLANQSNHSTNDDKTSHYEPKSEASIAALTSLTKTSRIKRAIVLCCYFRPFRGGVETYAYDYARMLVKCGYEVTVITSDRKHNQILPGKEELVSFPGGKIKILRLRRFGKNHYIYWLKNLYKTVNAINPDVIHRHGLGHIAFDIVIILFKLKNKLRRQKDIDPLTIITPHDPIMPRTESGFRLVFKFLYTLFLATYYNRIFDLVLAVNPEQHQWLKRLYGVSKSKIKLAPPVIEQPAFQYDEINAKKREEKQLTIVSLGRLTKYKGFADLIAAFNETNTVVDTKLIIAGAHDQYERELREIAARSPRREDISIETNISPDRKEEILLKAQIYVSTSSWEAFGISTAEAMSYANAVIASNTEGSRFLIKHGENGLLYRLHDFNELKQQIDKLINDTELLRAFQSSNYNKVKQFSFEHLCMEYSKIIAVKDS